MPNQPPHQVSSLPRWPKVSPDLSGNPIPPISSPPRWPKVSPDLSGNPISTRRIHETPVASKRSEDGNPISTRRIHETPVASKRSEDGNPIPAYQVSRHPAHPPLLRETKPICRPAAPQALSSPSKARLGLATLRVVKKQKSLLISLTRWPKHYMLDFGKDRMDQPGHDKAEPKMDTKRFFTFLTLAMSWFFMAGGLHAQAAKDTGHSMSATVVIRPDELRSNLTEFEYYFTSTIEAAVDELNAQTQNVQSRKSALRFQIHVIPTCRTLLNQEDVRRALIDVWVLTTRMVFHFEDSPETEYSGTSQTVLLDASKKLLEKARLLAKKFLPEKCYLKCDASVRNYARANPVTCKYSGLMVHATETGNGHKSLLDVIIDVPLAPFTIGKGIDEKIDQGVSAIRDFTGVADRFATDIKYLPESTRWQMLMLVYDLQKEFDLPALQGKLDRLSHSANNLASSIQVVSKTTHDLVDHIAWRLAQLATLIFVLVLIHRNLPHAWKTRGKKAKTGKRLALHTAKCS